MINTTSDDKRLKLIAAILNQAENTDVEAEKDTFFSAAQSMATKHGIDLAIARQFTKYGEKAKQNEVQVIRVEIGEKGDRGAGTYSDLMIGIIDANEIMWLRANDNSWVELYGMKFDIEYAKDLYAVLLTQMVIECRIFLDSDEWKLDGTTRSDARISFCYGFTTHIKQRLTNTRLEAERSAQNQHVDDGVSVALVLSDQRKEIRSTYYSKRSGLRTYYGNSGSNRAGHRSGHQSAANANLHSHNEISSRKSIS